ncbi:condensation domain-containing protein [Nocardia bhagyanarayanae]|uniref:Condensation domain-containing protein n=1 Tax=Nocardia bhagyanarayanae TaxID=1215925 RepID=A0A543FHH4_9NOCA|nr:condensation domain-containing protein [Nocardia bhagyanarayanae]TQM33309.1 condensation domain-containing protein [Nocardia bhagyanarayanae]
MVNFGLIDEWDPAPGRLISWVASADAVARAALAPVHPTPPSHQQEEYLQLAHRNAAADFRYSGLCVVTAEVPGTLDLDAMTRAVNAFLLRHDTFRSWFALASGQVRRHVMAPDVIDFVAVDHGDIDNAEAIREHVQKETPGPFQWDCFTFGVIQRADAATVYLAVDHLHTDGVAQYISCFDLAHLYAREMWGDTGALLQPASYLDYCAREREQSARLTPSSPGVRKWLELVRGNDGELPSFPLALGTGGDGYHRSAHLTVPLFDEAAARRFEQNCRANGAEFTGGIFAAAALAERELADSDYYFGMTPISTRSSLGELASVGWYVTLIPVAFPIGATATFARTVGRAQRAYDNGLRLMPVSFHRVLELVPADAGFRIEPGWSTPMISYVDARDFAGHEYFDIAHGGVYANRAASEEVLMWINRLPGGTSLSAIYPDTPVAHDSVRRYVTALRSVFVAASL